MGFTSSLFSAKRGREDRMDGRSRNKTFQEPVGECRSRVVRLSI